MIVGDDGTVYLTTLEAAVRLGVTPGRIRQFMLAGRIRTIKLTRDRLIPQSELAKLKNRRPGRPPSIRRKTPARRTTPRSSMRLPIREP